MFISRSFLLRFIVLISFSCNLYALDCKESAHGKEIGDFLYDIDRHCFSIDLENAFDHEWIFFDKTLADKKMICEKKIKNFIGKFPDINCDNSVIDLKNGSRSSILITPESMLSRFNFGQGIQNEEGIQKGMCASIINTHYLYVLHTCRLAFNKRMKRKCEEDIQIFLNQYPEINCSSNVLDGDEVDQEEITFKPIQLTKEFLNSLAPKRN